MHRALLDISVIVAASSLLAWLAAVLRQPIIVAYVACGILAGPSVLGLVSGTEFIDAVSQFGIILLLFHAGVVMHLGRLKQLALKAAAVTLGQTVLSMVLAAGFGLLAGLGLGQSLIMGLALTFSSTILTIKLMPTVALHHQHMGAYSIAILILQDLIAVAALMFIGGRSHPALLLLKGVVIFSLSLTFERWALRPAMMLIERYRELLFLLAIGWGMGMVYLADLLGFSPEATAFIAGLALARSPLSLFLSEGLKLFRDFFLVFFFFVLGARMDLAALPSTALMAILLSAVLILSKYLGFYSLFRATGESHVFSREAGLRLSQSSEFALIMALAALRHGRIGAETSGLIQLATLITMIVSSYLVVFRLPTPLGVTKGMKQD
jgi:Kef-type K+ transport system membrane component KefB